MSPGPADGMENQVRWGPAGRPLGGGVGRADGSGGPDKQQNSKHREPNVFAGRWPQNNPTLAGGNKAKPFHCYLRFRLKVLSPCRGGIGCRFPGKDFLSMDPPSVPPCKGGCGSKLRAESADVRPRSGTGAREPEQPGNQNRTEARVFTAPTLPGRGDAEKGGVKPPPPKQQKRRSFEECTHPLTSFAPTMGWE